MVTRDGHTPLTASGIATLYDPASMRPFAAASGSPFGPIAWTSTAAPSFQRPAWIDADESSATTVSDFPATAT